MDIITPADITLRILNIDFQLRMIPNACVLPSINLPIACFAKVALSETTATGKDWKTRVQLSRGVVVEKCE